MRLWVFPIVFCDFLKVQTLNNNHVLDKYQILEQEPVKMVKRLASIVSNRYEACLIILSKVTAQHLSPRKIIALYSDTTLEVGQSHHVIDVEDPSDSKSRSGMGISKGVIFCSLEIYFKRTLCYD